MLLFKDRKDKYHRDLENATNAFKSLIWTGQGYSDLLVFLIYDLI
jgi:hypothetical protein